MKNRNQQAQKASLYGTHAVREAWLNPARRIQALYITPQARGDFEDTIKEAQRQGLKRPSPLQVEKQELERLLPREAVHQGIALACAPLEETGLRDLMILADSGPRALLLMLDQVTDPHNVGAILRSASAFGATGVIMQSKHAPDLTGVLAKTACGAVEHIPVAFETNLSRTLEELKNNGFFAYGLDERGESTIGEIDPAQKSILVLGAEGPGIRRLVKEHCDQLVRLPTGGPIASLNVSNAAAVALYALKKH
ncbi:MAG: 23S rRNA (guanosine(2251)-2'-O)-methyltransferase RlmB [Alphaproteobacteria bacterium]|nr:23S rRNA (guanosine(2251)-2'-O)-methyltransferase RlmB [Alphaproteobacteria bacterium]